MAGAARINGAALARSILDFWFVEHGRDDWFARRQKFDDEIRERFGAAHQAARAGELEPLRADPDGALALIILLDQFSRNLFREDKRAFEQDAEARDIAREAIERGFDMAAPEKRRAFFYMPFMHSEDLADQARSVALFKERLPGSYNERYAVDHCDIIKRFGRFPHRNRILGRRSTPEETAYIESGGFNP
ncbi:MAG TPA: DUF924 family protein [Parvularculaceae bacterium]|nr:DUF924 family protein [Parvularculaceae bacterium]